MRKLLSIAVIIVMVKVSLFAGFGIAFGISFKNCNDEYEKAGFDGDKKFGDMYGFDIILETEKEKPAFMISYKNNLKTKVFSKDYYRDEIYSGSDMRITDAYGSTNTYVKDNVDLSVSTINFIYVQPLFNGLSVYGGIGMTITAEYYHLKSKDQTWSEETPYSESGSNAWVKGDSEFSFRNYTAGIMVYLDNKIYLNRGYDTNPDGVYFGIGFHR